MADSKKKKEPLGNSLKMPLALLNGLKDEKYRRFKADGVEPSYAEILMEAWAAYQREKSGLLTPKSPSSSTSRGKNSGKPYGEQTANKIGSKTPDVTLKKSGEETKWAFYIEALEEVLNSGNRMCMEAIQQNLLTFRAFARAAVKDEKIIPVSQEVLEEWRQSEKEFDTDLDRMEGLATPPERNAGDPKQEPRKGKEDGEDLPGRGEGVA